VNLNDEPPVPSTSRRVSLRELFDMHANYVWITMRRLGVPPSDVEDLVHDVFVQVQRHLDDYEPDRPARPWLFGFAFRLASEQRRRVFRRRETLTDPSREPVDTRMLADEQLEADEDRQLLLAALDAIALDKRAVFVLSQIDEVPMPEVASSLGIPLNTAYSRLRLARAEFAAELKRLRAQRRER
jgi:RNA polymerase sigma-70 factor (ECF subfamily)